MNKVNYLQFKKKLSQSGKSYFTLIDLRKFYPFKSASLKTLLRRWAAQGLINRLSRGYYAFDLADVDYLQIATTLVRPSYISLEYALNYYGLLDQVPQTITLVSLSRHKNITMGGYTLEYSHIKKELFFAYTLVNNFYIAEPEKAILDLIYLIKRGKRLADLDSFEIKKLNKGKINLYLKKYPVYIRKFIYEKFDSLII